MSVKIHWGGIRQASLGGEYDEDHCTNNNHRAKLQIDHAESGGLHVERDDNCSRMQTADKAPSTESAQALCENYQKEGRATLQVVSIQELNREYAHLPDT